MIRYDLTCDRGHGFEGWFGSIGDYDDQAETGLLRCPECGSRKVDKAIMAPALRRADPAAALADTIRTQIAENCDDVGDRFAQVARDRFRATVHSEKPMRGLYGHATAQEAKALHDEGIPVLPLPDRLNPKRAKNKLN